MHFALNRLNLGIQVMANLINFAVEFMVVLIDFMINFIVTGIRSHLNLHDGFLHHQNVFLAGVIVRVKRGADLGFIGFYVSRRLCEMGHEVIGLDNLNDYYNGELKRDFTDIQDILEGIIRIQNVIPEGGIDFKNDDPGRSSAPYRVYNIGNNQPVKLMDFIEAIENACGKKAIKNL